MRAKVKFLDEPDSAYTEVAARGFVQAAQKLGPKRGVSYFGRTVVVRRGGIRRKTLVTFKTNGDAEVQPLCK